MLLLRRLTLAAIAAAALVASVAHADDFDVGTSSSTVSNAPQSTREAPPPRPAAVAAVRG